MSNNVCNNVAYMNSIDQKRRFQLLNIPPVRYDNLSTNPYQVKNGALTYTKKDLDMRRKAEILKYSSNRMLTQTNSLTKAQKYAQAVTGGYQRRTYSQMYIERNSRNGVLNTCPPIARSTTASDVPGPPIMLYEDPTVPLYNLVNDADGTTYGLINQDQIPNPIPWKNTAPRNIIIPNDGTYSTITSIYTINIPTPSYNFNISTPIVLKITGSLLDGVTSYTDNNNPVSINVNIAPRIKVKYSYSDANLNAATTCAFVTNPNIVVNSIAIALNGNRSYTSTIYVGLLKISDLILPVQTGFIYDIQLAISYSIITSDIYNNKCSLPIITSIENSENIHAPIVSNCTITGNRPIPTPIPALHVI